MRPASSLILILALGLSACGDTTLRDLNDPAAGPEEFGFIPNKPLETPDNYTALPVPTPAIMESPRASIFVTGPSP